MVGSAPMGDGGPAWGTNGGGTSRTRPPPRVPGAPLPRGISGDGLPPRPAASTSASKKRRSTFVVPSRPPATRLGGALPRHELDADLDPGSVRPHQFPNAALALGAFVTRELFEAAPPGARLPSPLRHEHRQEGTSHDGSVFPGAGRKAQASSFSEPAQLSSHLVKKVNGSRRHRLRLLELLLHAIL
ncbi:unnamed protein product [Urochloa humidicola]